MIRLVPGYIHPSRIDLWNAVFNLTPRGSIVIINPNSGPGVARDEGWVEICQRAHRQGVLIFGYVPTWFGAGAHGVAPSVAELIAQYAEFYPGLVDGIFLDQWPSAFRVPDLEAAILYARRRFSEGETSTDATRVIVNPGASVTATEVTQYPVVRCTVTFEGASIGGDVLEPVAGVSASRQGCLLYGAENPRLSIDRLERAGWGYGWATSDPGPVNPWDADPTT